MLFKTLCDLMNVVEEEMVTAPKDVFDRYWAFRTGMAEFYASAKPETKVPEEFESQFRPFLARYLQKTEPR
jgi:hypothetical protein